MAASDRVTDSDIVRSSARVRRFVAVKCRRVHARIGPLAEILPGWGDSGLATVAGALTRAVQLIQSKG
jgi:hypothetical protein